MKTRLLLALALATLTACATIGGVGQDITTGADKVSGWMR